MTIAADEALAIGLVEDRATSAEDAAMLLAGTIAANARSSVAGLKRIVAGDPAADRLFEDAFGGDDFREGVSAFKARRAPGLRGMSRALLIADHASNHVPGDVDLDIDPALLNQHMAIDIGVAPLGALLCERLGMDGIFGPVSRLVIDLNREADAPGLIPVASDGFAIPGTNGLTTRPAAPASIASGVPIMTASPRASPRSARR